MKKTVLCIVTAALMFGFESDGMQSVRSDLYGADAFAYGPIADIFSFEFNKTGGRFEVQKTGRDLVFKNEELLSSGFSNFKAGNRPTVKENMGREEVADVIVSFFGKDEVTFLGGRDLPPEDPFAKLGKIVATMDIFRK
jgi:hypothetical protein